MMMVKVETKEQRQNLNRTRRLRKKLHVAEFKEYLVKLSVRDITSWLDDDEFDEFIDKCDQIIKDESLDGFSMAFTDEKGTTLYYIIPWHKFSSELAIKISKQISDSYGHTTLDEVDDAWYPREDYPDNDF